MIGLLSLATLLIVPTHGWDLENDDGGFISDGDTFQWEWGPIASGPLSSHDGSNAWATVLDGDYLNDSIDTLQLPALSLIGFERPILSFVQWVDIDAEGDTGRIEGNVDGEWTILTPVYGYSHEEGFTGSAEYWDPVFIDLSGLDDLSQVRLRFASDAVVSRSGWIVDDFNLWDGDPVPPKIQSVSTVEDRQDLESGPEVQATILEDYGDLNATIEWESDDGQFGSVAFTPTSSDEWLATMPIFEPNTTITWEVQATDGESVSTAGPWTYRVYLPAPTNLSGPDDRTIATEFELTWVEPEGLYPTTGYQVFRNGVVEVDTTATHALLNAETAGDTFWVQASFLTPLGAHYGDASSPIIPSISIPSIRSVVPNYGWPGDQLRLEIIGDYLLMTQSDVSLELGPSISLLESDVQDVDLARFTIEIDPEATPGPLDLTLLSGELAITKPESFTILSDSDRPQLLSIEPDALEQGERSSICIRLNSPLQDGALQVRLGEGVFVEQAWSDGLEVWVDALVDLQAPLGLNDVSVDDGTWIREGVQFRVRDNRGPTQRSCSATSKSKPTGWVSLVLLSVLFIRRKPSV